MEKRENPDLESRRRFLTGIAGAGAIAAVGDALAQAAPAAPATTPPAPPGTVPNDAIKGGKAKSMQFHSERPLTGSVPAHEHDFDVTPSEYVSAIITERGAFRPPYASQLRGEP